MSPIAFGALARRCAAALTTSALAALAACASGGTATQDPTAQPAAARQGVTPAAPQTGAYVVRLGADTITAERYTRRGNEIDVEQAVRTPQASLRHYHLQMTPTGDLASVDVMLHPIGGAPGAPLLGRTTLTLTGDSATVEMRRADTVVRRRVAASGRMIAAPALSFVPHELAAMRLVASGQDSIQVQFIAAIGQPAGSYTVRRSGADSVLFVNPNITYRARVDREGRLLGLHAPASTFKIVLERVPALDVTALATAWSQAPAMGVLSPADSVKATIGGANVSINYSRPRKRGRVLFGDSLVAMEPWGKVWRAGANEATRLTTDRDLVIGGATVPAGTYTLWVLLDPTAWKLIINKQTLRPDNSGRPLWGTMYDPQHDLARVNMTTTRVPTPTEQYVITLDPQGPNAAVLKLTWDTYQASVPVQAK